MDRNTARGVIAGAILGWVGVGIVGIWEIADGDAGDSWERQYLFFSLALLLAASCSLAVGWASTRGAERTTLRRWGLGVGMLAVVSTLVAWALPLWMSLIALTFVLLAAAAPRRSRSSLAAIAGAQIIGLAALFVAIAAEVGPKDSYGDHPAAFGIGALVTAVVSVSALVMVARAPTATDAGSTRHAAPTSHVRA